MYLTRRAAGDTADFDALCQAHPDLAGELRTLEAAVELAARVPHSPGAVPLSKQLKEEIGSEIEPRLSLDQATGQESDSPGKLMDKLRAQGPRGTRYKLLGEIARGGMGAIIKIWDDELRRTLAMKIVLGKGGASAGETSTVDPRMLSRFLEEAQVTGQLDHPGIVPVHELGLASDGSVYFTMRLVVGEDLHAVFKKVRSGEDGWSQVRALGVMLKVCEAMSYAHSKQVVHRDLKPANVMVGKFGEVYVMDWGLARVLGREDSHDLRIKPQTSSSSTRARTERREETPDSPLLTMDGDVVGTPSFMPPEQARGQLEKLGVHSDVYALGAMLYQLIAGEMPYTARGESTSQITILTRLLDGPPRPLYELAPRTSAELVAIVEKAMAREASQRYADTLALAEDLRAYLERRVVGAYEAGAWAEAKKWVHRNTPLAASMAAAVVLLIAGFATSLVFKAKADDQARTARWNGYVGVITGAEAAGRAGESASLRRLLDSAPEALRNWEWGHLNAASDTSLFKLEGHTGSVGSACFSPDGTRIVTASEDGTARVWDASSGVQLAKLEGHTDRLRSAGFSPDGTRIATASNDNTMRVWDASSGAQLAKLEGDSASFSPDGTRIVTVSAGNTARVWDASSGALLAKLEGHTGQVVSASFSPDGMRIVMSSNDYTARVWSASSGAQLATLEGHTGQVVSASFSPDGTRIVTAAADKTAQVWDASSGAQLARLEGHTRGVLNASFSPDGMRILTTSEDNTARVWDASSGVQLATLAGHTDIVVNAAFSPDGTRIVTASWDKTARVWEVSSGTQAAKLEGHARWLWHASFSPDGTRITTASNDTVRVWDASSGAQLAKLDADMAGFTTASFSSDGTRIVTGSDDHAARVWDASSGGLLMKLEGHTGSVWNAIFSPDGTRIVTASMDKTARVWDASSGMQLAKLEGHAGWLKDASFSPDGTRILTASMDKTARVWDASSGVQLAQLEGHTREVSSARFSPDGTRIVTASMDKTARVWDTSSCAQLAQLEGHTREVSSASFSPDGTRIVTASMDKTARVWDASSGVQLAKLEGHELGLWHASFSPDGTRIVTASMDKTARVWDSVPYRVRHAER